MNTPFDQTPASTPKTSERASNFVRATGRTRKAGYWVCGGGIAVVLSAFLPWVSYDGTDASHPTGSGVLLLLGIGGMLAYFGTRVLSDRLTKSVNVALWVVAAVDVLFSAGIFAAASHLNNQGDGIVSVSPAIGLYVGIGGLIAGVVGTVLAQTVRHKRAAATQPAENGR